MFCRSLFVILSFFLLASVLSVLLRFTDSCYSFGIFELSHNSITHTRRNSIYVNIAGLQGKKNKFEDTEGVLIRRSTDSEILI